MNKKGIITAMVAGTMLFSGCEELLHLSSEIDKINQEMGGVTQEALSNEDIIAGLKQALEVGIMKGASAVSVTDGFFKNASIKIPFPQEVKEVEEKARQFGLDNQVDQFVLTLNRAAEEASKEAKPIFIEVIKNMSIIDAMGILKGADNAATEYLKKNTTAQLTEKFKPVIHNAIEKVEVTKYWNPVMNAYNRLPGVEKKSPNLDDYVTERALIGLFQMVEKEEKNIRQDPMARTTDLLKKVFGSL